MSVCMLFIVLQNMKMYLPSGHFSFFTGAHEALFSRMFELFFYTMKVNGD